MKQRFWTVLYILGLCFIIAPYLYISTYTIPVVDDYSYVDFNGSVPLLERIIYFYKNVGGRYFSNFLLAINPSQYPDLALYKTVPLILFGLFFSGVVFLFKALFRDKAFIKIILYSFVFTLLYIYQVPAIADGFYWYSASIIYISGNILFLFLLGMLAKLYFKDFIFSKIFHYVLMTILVFLIIGCNEIILMFVIGLLGYIVLINPKKTNGIWIILGIGLFFAVFAVFAPGVSSRRSGMSNDLNIINIGIMSGAQVMRFAMDWMSSLPLFLVSVLYYRLHNSTVKSNGLFASSFRINPLISFALLFGVIFLSVFPPYLFMGILGQYRTLNVGYLAFLLIWFVNLSAWFNYVNERGFKPFVISNYTQIAMAILIGASLFITKNGYGVMIDLQKGYAVEYATQMKARYDLKFDENIANTDTIYIDKIKDRPHTLFVVELNEDPQHWINFGYARYLGDSTKVILLK